MWKSSFLLSSAFLQFSCRGSSQRIWSARRGKGRHWRRRRRDLSWTCYRRYAEQLIIAHILNQDSWSYFANFSSTVHLASVGWPRSRDLLLLNCVRQANLESLPPHVPTYSRAAVGPPSTSSRRHYCSVCGSTANYTCVRCGTRFCSCRCQVIHNDTRCLKFVAWSICLHLHMHVYSCSCSYVQWNTASACDGWLQIYSLCWSKMEMLAVHISCRRNGKRACLKIVAGEVILLENGKPLRLVWMGPNPGPSMYLDID